MVAPFGDGRRLSAGEGRIFRPGETGLPGAPESGGGDAAARAERRERRPIRTTAALARLHIDHLAKRANGFDAEEHWSSALSLGEQQLVSVARLLLAAPQFAFLHRVGTTLAADQVADVLRALTEYGITYVAFEADHSREAYDAVLTLGADGAWTWAPS
jgi:putative ATP-binding cassette transporter